jgi:hypothetical protein
MFKTRSVQTKESFITIGTTIGIILLVLVNIALLLPSLISVFGPQHSQIKQDPIDTSTVNEAIKLIGP